MVRNLLLLIALAVTLLCFMPASAFAQQSSSATVSGTTTAALSPSNTTAPDDDDEEPWQRSEAYRDALIIVAVICGVVVVGTTSLIFAKLATEGHTGGTGRKQHYGAARVAQSALGKEAAGADYSAFDDPAKEGEARVVSSPST